MVFDNSRALIVEGGAMRGIFASGVLDAFMATDFRPYDFAMGVSAGASNLLGYLSHQPKRSYNVITELATSNRFFNPRRFLKGGDLVDVNWLWKESNRRYPIDKRTLFSSIPIWATVTNVSNGHADYYRITESNIKDVMVASAALPIAVKTPPCFSGGCYTDGGVADSIPVKEAYRRGARDITVILSHPLSYHMNPTKHPWLMKKLLSRYPGVAEAILHRAENYNASLEFIRNPPADSVVKVIAPPENFPVKRLTMKPGTIEEGYLMGVEAGHSHIANLMGRHGLTEENCHFCI
ncbi:patatin family protein (plasmid) [Photobacterium sp. DA100]|uniref:patatin-like phospholipase family protein n=1 Tax=Photobacterium sp. DA100 TaxID=3027472 RepID=UPI0024795D7B|nr:patatin family protein [Photobacterium sp. DA100]WEM45496.1 patatin family protein [Photobacterium sp. DA100]